MITIIRENVRIIQNSAEKMNIDPRLLAGIIYAEHRLNVNLVDKFEHIYASLGSNSSIGLTQIRVNTAKWIIAASKDSNSLYFIAQKYNKWLPHYETDYDIIRLLKNNATNSLLAAAHLRQIIRRWEKAGYDISKRPDIVATLYSYGLVNRQTGEDICPHENPRTNFLGKVAASFYYGDKLRRELQRE